MIMMIKILLSLFLLFSILLFTFIVVFVAVLKKNKMLQSMF